MEKFATLEPVRLYASSAATTLRSSFSHPPSSNSASRQETILIGRLPSYIHTQILKYISLPDVPAYIRVCRATRVLVDNEAFWGDRLSKLGIGMGAVTDTRQDQKNEGKAGLEAILDLLEVRAMEELGLKRNGEVPTVAVEKVNEPDDFGDFQEQDVGGEFMMGLDDEMGDFIGASSSHSAGSLPVPPAPSLNLFTTPQLQLPLAPTNLTHPGQTIYGTQTTSLQAKPPRSNKQLYKRAHMLLKPLVLGALGPSTPPHLVLSSLTVHLTPLQPLPQTPRSSLSQAPHSARFSSTHSPSTNSSNGLHSDLTAPIHQPTLQTQSMLLSLLSSFLSPALQPLRSWAVLRNALRAVMDRFDASLLTAFDSADSRGDESGMREAAEASWAVWCTLGEGPRLKSGVGQRIRGVERSRAIDWEMGKVWAEKREIFYEQGKWNALDNFTSDQTLDFTAMDEFMQAVLGALREHGARAVRVFPPHSQVLLDFADRIAGEVVGEYITTLLTRAREIQSESGTTRGDIFLTAAAASFREAWRMVDAILVAAAERDDSGVTKEQGEDVVYQMFESNMDEYLDEEVESVKHALEAICKGWERDATFKSSNANDNNTTHSQSQQSQPRFLSSQNPAQVKRNVLASFTSVLLLPVTIVPRVGRGVGGALMTGGSAAVQGIAMLNPQRWGAVGSNASGGGVSAGGWGGRSNGGGNGHMKLSGAEEKDEATLFEVGAEEDEEDDEDKKSVDEKGPVDDDPWAERDKTALTTHTKLPLNSASRSSNTSTPVLTSNTPPNSSSTPHDSTEKKLELLLSLDVALEVIHADRESLKRVETFAGYPGHYGHRVRDTIEEIFILMLQALGEGHLSKGFSQATEQMTAYKPAEHAETTSVAPLLQFFELVHIGDTIQSMVQVYFDKELAHHIDRTDFLNAVVREKKRFENALDDSVASGLNAGTEVLMNQVEHIILTLTKPREYYPPEDSPLDLGPTKGCTEAIKCLEMHCRLLKGSTSKEVLEVFHQEVGIRLIAILQKHIKRQIISLNGGFQVIADLNIYHAFISSLKVPSITSDFAHLKMLGHVYVVEDAKDLAQIVRDVTRYGGAYRPEDVYEFIQRRSDWKKIEKTVDKTMYNLSFKEDCVVC